MRGYTQQNVSMNSTVQESFLSKKIEDYTIKDCEDFLAKYPKDLDADRVRKRLERLNPKGSESDTTSIKRNHKQRKYSESTNNASSKKTYSKPNKDILDYTLDECLEFINHNPNDSDVELVKVVLAEHRRRIRENARKKTQENNNGCSSYLIVYSTKLLATVVLFGLILGIQALTGFSPTSGWLHTATLIGGYNIWSKWEFDDVLRFWKG